MTIVCYAAAALRDPGQLPAGADSTPAGMEACPRCEQCGGAKPERAHHCSECDRCVLRMEHHCSWLGQCVGLRNHKAFVLLVAYGSLGVLAALLCLLSTPWPQTATGVGLYCVLWPVQLLLAFFAVQHGQMQLYLVQRDMTSVEEVVLSGTWGQGNYWKLAPADMDRVTNRYDRGTETNVREFMGHGQEAWRLALWPMPTAPDHAGVEWHCVDAHVRGLAELKDEIEAAINAGLERGGMRARAPVGLEPEGAPLVGP